MNETSNQARAIFLEAIEQQSLEGRALFLEQACAGDQELRARVDRLVKSHELLGTFHDEPRLAAATIGQPVTEIPGDTIGPYKLLQQIGEGGMGVVFMAEQSDPIQRTVALKIIKPGMDTRQVIARFEAERQALAMMDHPNIAKVLDAGTTDTGRPYFVMDLVKGVPVTDYCDQQQLSVRARLELMAAVCHAVQHAHQKGIIHRDLKPSNVLVAEYDGKPVPKVIDFGVAKATAQKLTERTMFTQYGQIVGTFEYMSPEQARFNQLDIDTRSDIYSLGVLLYEVLAGSTPLEKERLRTAAFNDVLRLICEEEPPLPSLRLSSSQSLPSISAQRHAEPAKLTKLVRGELDWIVMKCLEKDRNRRYETASSLAMDLQRYLTDETVEARPATSAYRLRKFIRRNKVAVLAGSAIAAALILGLGLSTWLFVRERAARVAEAQQRTEAVRQRKQAEANETKAFTEAAKSKQVAQFLKDMLKGVAPSVALGRDTTMLKEIVDQTAQRVDKDLQDQPEVQIELHLTLGKAYFELQLYKQMELNARHTLELARATYGQENAAVADALFQLGRAQLFLRAIGEGDTVTRQAIAMQRKVRGDGSAEEADALCNLADLLRNEWDADGDDQKKLAEAEPLARAGLAIRRKRFGNDSDETAWALHALAVVLWEEKKEGKLAESEATIREAFAIRERIHGEQHPYTAWDRRLLGKVLNSRNKLDEAEKCFREALATMGRLDGKGKLSQMDTYASLGEILRKRGKLAEAEIEYREAVAIGTKEVGPDFLDLPMYLVPLAGVLAEQNKLAEAREAADQAVEICKRHPDQVYPKQQENAVTMLREIMTKLGGDSAKREVPEISNPEKDAAH